MRLQVRACHVVDWAETTLPALARIGHLLAQLCGEERTTLLELEASFNLVSDALNLFTKHTLSLLKDALRLARNRQQNAHLQVVAERRFRHVSRDSSV